MIVDLEAHLIRQREFSLKTFGPGARTKGVCDHIRKELLEISVAPKDIMEWVDVIILAFDGTWRAGILPSSVVASMGFFAFPRLDMAEIIEEILETLIVIEAGNGGMWVDVANLALLALEKQGWPREAVWHAVVAKQIKNESRRWPDWRTAPKDKAIEHDREVSQ